MRSSRRVGVPRDVPRHLPSWMCHGPPLVSGHREQGVIDMPRFVLDLRSTLLAGAAMVCLAPAAQAATFIVTGNDNAGKTLAGGETGTVDSTGNLTTTDGNPAVTWTPTGTGTAVLNNSGTINGTTGRGIDENTKATTAQSFTLNN